MKPRDAVAAVATYAVPPGNRRDKIRLDLNENTRGCSPAVLQALRDIGEQEVSSYPDYGELTAAIGRRFELPDEAILLTNGADDAIRGVMQTWVDHGHEVVLAEPSFTMTQIHAEVMGGVVREVGYGADLEFPAAAMLDAIGPQTRLVAVTRPDSPTGAVISRDDLVALLRKLEQGILLLDETYWHFLGETCIDLARDHANLVVAQSFSKACGLAGLRLGFLVSQPQNIEQLRKVNPPFSANSLAVVAGLAALEDERHLKRVVEQVREGRARLLERLAAIGVEARDTPANFVLADVGEEAPWIHDELSSQGVLVKNLHDRPGLAGWFRIGVGTDGEQQVLIDALAGLLRPQAVLFDMDGVLVDVSGSYRVAIRETASHFAGEEISDEEVERCKREGGYNNDWDLTEELVRRRGKSPGREEIVRRFQERYLGNDFDGAVTNERWLFARERLQELRERYRLGIVTGRPRDEALQALRRFDVEELFEVVIAREEMGDRPKPDPYGILLALDRLGVRRAVYAGDTVDDVGAAARARVVPVGVLPPQSAEDEELAGLLKQSGAQCVLRSVEELSEVLP